MRSCILLSYQPNHLDIPLLKLVLQLREGAQFGRAYRREVRWVGEEDAPFATKPLVEVDLASCRFGLEVRGF